MSHSPEPWAADRMFSRTPAGEFRETGWSELLEHTCSHVFDVDDGTGRNDDVDRIVACVNACAGIETEWLMKYGVVRRAAQPLSEIDWEDLA